MRLTDRLPRFHRRALVAVLYLAYYLLVTPVAILTRMRRRFVVGSGDGVSGSAGWQPTDQSTSDRASYMSMV
jgi:hypothetical protein